MNKTPPPAKSRPATRLKLAGILVLVFGLSGAGLIYWRGTQSEDWSDNPAMLRYHQPAEQQMQMLYGKQGRLIGDLSNRLQQPGTQALLLAAVTIIVAGGCFYLAKPRTDGEST
jgi:hypothetical protein